MTNIATVIYEENEQQASDESNAVYRSHINHQLAGAEKLEGSHPFDLEKSHKAYRLNHFLHKLTQPEHRARFASDLEALMSEYQLTDVEKDLVRNHKWIEMIHYGVIFFVLEKMAPVVGVTNPEVYASFKGMTLEAFQQTRKVAIKYSVAGGDKASSLDD